MLAELVAFAGLPAGIMLGKVVQEEVIPGRAWLDVVARMLFITYLALLLPLLSLPVAIVCLLVIVASSLKSRPLLAYVVFALTLSESVSLLSLIFCYGLAAGSWATSGKNSILSSLASF